MWSLAGSVIGALGVQSICEGMSAPVSDRYLSSTTCTCHDQLLTIHRYSRKTIRMPVWGDFFPAVGIPYKC